MERFGEKLPERRNIQTRNSKKSIDPIPKLTLASGLSKYSILKYMIRKTGFSEDLDLISSTQRETWSQLYRHDTNRQHTIRRGRLTSLFLRWTGLELSSVPQSWSDANGVDSASWNREINSDWTQLMNRCRVPRGRAGSAKLLLAAQTRDKLPACASPHLELNSYIHLAWQRQPAGRRPDWRGLGGSGACRRSSEGGEERGGAPRLRHQHSAMAAARQRDVSSSVANFLVGKVAIGCPQSHHLICIIENTHSIAMDTVAA